MTSVPLWEPPYYGSLGKPCPSSLMTPRLLLAVHLEKLQCFYYKITTPHYSGHFRGASHVCLQCLPLKYAGSILKAAAALPSRGALFSRSSWKSRKALPFLPETSSLNSGCSSATGTMFDNKITAPCESGKWKGDSRLCTHSQCAYQWNMLGQS